MSNDQDGCECVNVSSGTGLPGSRESKAVKRLCVCVLFIIIQRKIIHLGRELVHFRSFAIVQPSIVEH